MVVLENPSIANPESVMQIEDSYTVPEWARAVVEHVKEGRLPGRQEGSSKNQDADGSIYIHR